MARLEAPEALQRLRDNENRFDRFMNGSEATTYTTSDGRTVPSILKLIGDFSTTLNASGTGWLALAQEAAENIDDVRTEINSLYDQTVLFGESLDASIAQVNAAKTEAENWATSLDPMPNGLRSARWYAENLNAGTVTSFNGRLGVVEPSPDDYPIDFLMFDENQTVKQVMDNMLTALITLNTSSQELFSEIFALKNKTIVSELAPTPEEGVEGDFWYQLEEV